MGVMKKLLDARNTADGKVLAILLAVLLAVSVVNFAAFASSELANDGDASVEQTAADESDSAADQGDAAQAGDDSADNASEQTPSQPASDEANQGAADQGASASNAANENASDTQASSDTDSADKGSSEAASPENASAPGKTEKPENKVDEASVLFVTDQAYIEILGETLQMPETRIKVKVGKELTFKALPNNGRQIDAVYANDEVLPAQADSTYVIPAQLVNSRLVVKVTTVESSVAEGSKSEAITGDTKLSSLTDPSESDDASQGDAVDETPVATTQTDAGDPVVVTKAKVAHADVAKPAFEGYAYAGGVVVKVTAPEGVLPEGAKVRAALIQRADIQSSVETAVGLWGQSFSSMTAIDVTMTDKSGNEIQPDGAVNICFFNNGVQGSQMSVVRVADDASSVSMVSARQIDADCASFDVDHFTIFAVVGTIDLIRVDNKPFLTTKKTVAGKNGLTEITKAGDVVVYTVTVENAGNTVMNFTEDAFLDEKAPEGAKLDKQTLAVGESAQVSYEYAVTQAEIDAGLVENVAVVGGQDPAGNDVACVAENYITMQPNADDPAAPVIKHPSQQGESTGTEGSGPEGAGTEGEGADGAAADPNQPASDAPGVAEGAPRAHMTVVKALALGERPANGKKFVNGEVISYEIIVANDGDVPLTNVVVTDDLAEFVSEPVANLAPGAKQSFRVDYTATEFDAAAGAVVNVAVAEGVTPEGEPTEQFFAEHRVLVEAAPVPPATPSNPNPTPIQPRDNTAAVNMTNAVAAPARAVDDLFHSATQTKPVAEDLAEDATPLANRDHWMYWYVVLAAVIVLAGSAVAALRIRSRRRIHAAGANDNN